MASAWVPRAAAGIHYREWDGEFVVYSGLSAATHLLGPASAAALLTLMESDRALTIEGLRRGLGLAESSADTDRQETLLLAGILDELERIELIEAVAI